MSNKTLNNINQQRLQATHFATFGRGHLKEFNINPMNVMVYMEGKTEGELRQRLREEPFNNNYMTTYPISEAQEMDYNYGMKLISIDKLLRLMKWNYTK